jgi:hypothetical protein
MTRFIANLGEHAKILIVPVQVDYKEYFNKLKSGLTKQSEIYELSKKHIEMSERYVFKNYENHINDYEVYIMTSVIRLK